MTYAAIVRALESATDDWVGKLYTDSKSARRGLLGHKVESLPWQLPRRLQAVRKRFPLKHHQVIFLKGHPTAAELRRGCTLQGVPVSPYNETLDRTCSRLCWDYLTQKGVV